MLFHMCLIIELFVELMMVHILHHIQIIYWISYNQLLPQHLLNLLIKLIFENINQFLYLLYKCMDKMDADLLEMCNLKEVHICLQIFFLIWCH